MFIVFVSGTARLNVASATVQHLSIHAQINDPIYSFIRSLFINFVDKPITGLSGNA